MKIKNFNHHLLLWVIPLLIIMTPLPTWAGHDQQILDREITLELKDVPLSLALNRIEAVAGVKFVYSPSQIDLQRTVSIEANNKKLRAILNDLLGPIGISFIADRDKEHILLKPIKSTTKNHSSTQHQSLALQTMELITGTVVDAATLKAIPGVNIIVKGTTFGTTTDTDGRYAINADEDQILVFSFIGYKTLEYALEGKAVVDVMLEQDARALKEVEVRSTGYWTDTKERSTANIARITAKDIERQPVTSPLLALQGRVAGLEITPQNGAPGSAPTIRIRGENSLRPDGGYPLYIIDGIPVDSRPLQSGSISLMSRGFDPLSTINPGNIESIEILKDADATSIYGR